MGRPSKFTDKIANEICERLGKGEPLAQICRSRGMPGLTTVYDWQNRYPVFSERFARAREAGFDMIATDGLNIVDDKSEDPASRRVRSDYRLKLLAKWDPKRYGEKVDITSGDKPIGDLDETAVAARVASLLKTGLDRDGAR